MKTTEKTTESKWRLTPNTEKVAEWQTSDTQSVRGLTVIPGIAVFGHYFGSDRPTSDEVKRAEKILLAS